MLPIAFNPTRYLAAVRSEADQRTGDEPHYGDCLCEPAEPSDDIDPCGRPTCGVCSGTIK